MPKSIWDWFAVASLWLGSALMAIKATDMPLITGAPLILSAHFWNYVPLLLITVAALMMIYTATAKPVVHVAAINTSLPEIPLSKSLVVSELNDDLERPPQSPEAKIFVGPEVTSQFLMNFFDGRTTIQARALLSPYIGKWTKVTGKFRDLSKTPVIGGKDRYLLHLETQGDLVELFYFTNAWGARLEIITPGTKVTLIGKITGVENLWVNVESCELI